ncbi:B12-binding domain-containing radical SAM protein [Chitinophagaceae bacterium MMS25-I14]
MRILFTHSYFLQFDEKQWNLMQPYAPLGTLFAASFLREHGYEVALHDVMFLNDPKAIQPVLESFKPQMLVIYDDGFNYLTKMCLTNMREAAFEMSKLAKSMGCTVAVSSSDSTDHFNKYLDNGADFVMLGEAEHTLLDLANGVRDNNLEAGTIPGLAYREDGQTVRTAARPVLNDLDSLPLPAWDLADMQAYKKAWMGSTGYFSINMSTTRGCPFKCNWCAKPIYGNRYNARTPENVFSEVKMLHETYHFDHIWFCDDIFGLKPGWVKRFAELLKQSGIRIRFKIQSRADLLLKDEQVTPLAEAGCETVWMGAESGSQKILDAMDKGITVQQIQEAVQQLKAHKIRTALFLQFGYLSETKEDIVMTLDMLRRLMPDEIGISVSYPLPGTKFYEKVKEELKSKTNWTDSDEMAMMFHSTYPPEFYKKLHRYVHTYYRKLTNLKKAEKLNVKALIKMPLYAYREQQQKKILL